MFIARRYLRAKRKQMVMFRHHTAISVIGVAAGVMALVIALAINNGFRDTLQRNLLGATAHVSILEKEPGTGIEHWEQLAPQLARLPHVKIGGARHFTKAATSAGRSPEPASRSRVLTYVRALPSPTL